LSERSRRATSTGGCGSWKTPVPRAREVRLARLTAEAVCAEAPSAVDRCAISAWVAVCAVVNDGLAQAGIDPARARALCLAPHPNPVPASGARGRSEEFRARDSDGLASKFAAKIGDMAPRYQDGSAPDFANASSAELFAWCLARPAHEPGTTLRDGASGEPNATHTPAPLHAGIVG
jgi:hypothetical protein